MDSSKRFVTIVLAAGVVVLLAAILVGERMGDRVLGQVSDHAPDVVPTVSVTPEPDETAGAYGPNWKAWQTLSAAGDPNFPDPRIPPKPLPTVPPPPKATTPTPLPTETPNPNIPIWDQKPFRTLAPSATPTLEPSGEPTASPGPGTANTESEATSAPP